MAAMHSIAGEKFYIGTASISDKDADFTESDFSGVSWIEVTGWTQLGAFGDSRTVVTSDQIGNARTKKAGGTLNAGSMENTFDRNPADSGQKKLAEAMAAGTNYPFRVVDPLRSGQSTAAEALFIGIVTSSSRSGGGPNDPDRISATVEVNSNIVTVAAT